MFWCTSTANTPQRRIKALPFGARRGRPLDRATLSPPSTRCRTAWYKGTRQTPRGCLRGVAPVPRSLRNLLPLQMTMVATVAAALLRPTLRPPPRAGPVGAARPQTLAMRPPGDRLRGRLPLSRGGVLPGHALHPRPPLRLRLGGPRRRQRGRPSGRAAPRRPRPPPPPAGSHHRGHRRRGQVRLWRQRRRSPLPP